MEESAGAKVYLCVCVVLLTFSLSAAAGRRRGRGNCVSGTVGVLATKTNFAFQQISACNLQWRFLRSAQAVASFGVARARGRPFEVVRVFIFECCVCTYQDAVLLKIQHKLCLLPGFVLTHQKACLFLILSKGSKTF